MNRDDIIRMAREAGFGHLHAIGCRANAWGECNMGCEGQIERFAALVATAEREACAKLCEAFSVDRGIIRDEILKKGVFAGANMCAAAIRATGLAQLNAAAEANGEEL